MFFSFDGIDGVGKSTQVDLFCQWLSEQGRKVCRCRDPGSTPLGDRVREILLHSSVDTPIAPRSEMLLYMAARAQLVEEVIGPALARGEWVVSDRYLLANVVYQGHAGGLSPEVIAQVGEVAVAGVYPDCVILLDLDPASAAERIDGPGDRMESRGDAYRVRLRAGYLKEAQADPARIHVVDASQTIEKVHADVRRVAEQALRST
ncbi:MAG: dTMP kinase [Planctomycetales bacterium]|nr:dTMP kinase [Planctomycetales bacterium]